LSDISTFQFLIGSLEAFEKAKPKVEEIMFQFLIGSLEAKLDKGYCMAVEFQFLIGSLEADQVPSEVVLMYSGFNSS